MPNKLNLAGHRFGRLTILFAHENIGNKTQWVCYCECGNVCVVRTSELRNGHSKSCGCLRKEVAAKRGKEMLTTHGMTRTPEHMSFHAMIARCHRKTHKSYERYGARGIKVCKRWRHSFENFYEDMGPRPTKKHTLGRIDNDKGYCPENCRWETPKQQMNNISINHMININGFERTLAQWCDHFDIDYQQVYQRITKRGWEPIKALTTPIGFKNRNFTINGETKSLRQWAKTYNIGHSTVEYRLSVGYSIYDALTKPHSISKININGMEKTMREWADFYKVSYNVVRRRVYRGWSIHKALTTPVKSPRKK